MGKTRAMPRHVAEVKAPKPSKIQVALQTAFEGADVADDTDEDGSDKKIITISAENFEKVRGLLGL
jgi:MOSC domain-containing protein YiiM